MMNFSNKQNKQTQRYTPINYVDQCIATGYVREQANTTPAKMRELDMAMLERDHPFYEDWPDWQEIVKRYHSEQVKQTSKIINKGHGFYAPELTLEQQYLVHEVYWLSNMMVASIECGMLNGEMSMKAAFEREFSHFQHVNILSCELNCDCPLDYRKLSFPSKGCVMSHLHNQAHIIALIWAYVHVAKPRRTVRKYFTRLERVVLALKPKQLARFNLDYIIKPKEFSKYGRPLLKDLYIRGFLDVDLTVRNVVERCEYLKHFIPKQQDGFSCQSGRETVFDEMLVLAKELFSKDDSVMDHLCLPLQQGFPTIYNSHSWDEGNLEKIKLLIDNARADFFSSFKETMVDCSKTLIVLFIAASIVALLARIAIGASAILVYKLIHLICSFVCGVEDREEIRECLAQQQSGETPEEITDMPILPRLITKYIIDPPQKLLGTIWTSKETDRVMKRISYLGDSKIENGLDRIMTWIKRVLRRTQSWFLSTFLGIDVPTDLDGDDHAINKWNNEVDELIDSYYSNELVWTEATWSVIHNLYSRGLAFTRNRAYIRFKNDVWKVVSKLGNLLEEFKKHNKDGQSIRNPPVTIYLSGDTGVGKSALTYPLAIHLLKEIFAVEKNPIDLKDHWKSLIYMRSAEQEYWDGYENQLVTLFDDFNQQVDSGANPSVELFEIIRASNCFPYPLHMASIEQKATTTFTSKIIIVSTNNPKPKTQSLNFPTALQRRFDICVRVSRKPNIKLEKGAKFTPDIYKFERYDMVSGSELGSLSFKDLIDLSTMEYFSRSKFVDSIDEYIESILRVPTPEQTGVDEVDNPFAQQQGGFKCFQMTDMKSEADAQMEGILYNHAKSWYEQLENKKIEIGQSYFSRIKNKICSWWSPSTMDGLRSASRKLRETAQERLSWFKSLKQRFPFIEKMKTPMCLLMAGLSFIALFYGIKKLFSKAKVKTEKEILSPIRAKAKALVLEARNEGYNPPQVKQVRNEGYNPAVVKTVKTESYSPAIVKPVRAESIPRKEAIEQGIRDVNAAEIMMKISRTNVYKMYESTHGAPIGHIFFLRGRVAVMPKHYMYALKQSLANDSDATLYFEAIALSRCFQIRVADFLDNIQSYESPDEEGGPVYTRDLMAVAVPSAIVHTDAIPYIADKNNFSYVDYTSVMLPVLVKNNLSKSDKAVLLLRYAEGKSQLRRVNELPIGDSETPVLRIVRDVWEYNMDTQVSECGAPLIVRNKEIAPGKVCGIHIAGINGTGEGFSTPFYKEDALRILKSFDDKYTMQQSYRVPLKEYESIPQQQCQIPEDSEFIRLGCLNSPIAQPSKSKIQPSLAYGKIREPVTKPCALGPRKVDGEEFDPRKYRISRLGNVPDALDVKLINNSKEALIDEISGVFSRGLDSVSNNVKKDYTFEEAVLGIDGEPFINAVKRTTSAGYPFVQEGKTRFDFFGKADLYDLENENCQVLKKRVEEIVECAKNGVVLDHYFMDTLKDERKPIKKAHKTRLFSAGPLDYLIACKMYFNGIVALLSQFRNKCHVSVGTNPYSQDWGQIARLMEAKSKDVIAGDFEGFDASQHQLLLEASGEVLIALSQRFLGSTDEDVRVMRVLLVSLINSLHISGKEVYQWTHSLPSGHYLTAIINSIFVNISFGCIWQLAFNEITYASARTLWMECGLVAYGDDHILTVPPHRLNAFNQMNILGLFDAIGLSYTMEDKDAVATQKSRRLEEISYLKRKFAWDNQAGIWLAPLSLDTVLETPMWMHKCPDARQQTIANLEWALKELSLHDAHEWEMWSTIIRKVGQDLGHYTMLTEQNYARVVCLSQDFEM